MVFLPLVLTLAALLSTVQGAENPLPARWSVIPEDPAWDPDPWEGPPPANALWFPVGEELTYTIYWKLVPVAQTRITTSWVRWPDGQPVLRIRYLTRSNRVISAIYPVHDRHDSFIDPETFLPLRFVKDQQEGRHRRHDITDFDHVAGKARWRRLAGQRRDYELPIEPTLRDIPSLAYWIRREGLTPGTNYSTRVMADDKVYDLELATAREIVRLSAAGFDDIPCLPVSPRAQFEGLFVWKGPATLFISQGAPCLVIRMEVSIPVVGRIRAVLTEIGGPGREEWRSLWSARTNAVAFSSVCGMVLKRKSFRETL